MDIVFRKDGSVNSSQDRGYVLIPNYRPSVPITITFETDGGSSIDPIQMMSGNKITKPTDPTKIDWYFGGWYSDSGLTKAWNFDTIVYENTTLYAKWKDTPEPEFWIDGYGFVQDAIVSANGYSISGPIAIPSSHTITWSWGKSRSIDYHLQELDENLNYLSYWGSGSDSSTDIGIRTLPSWDYPSQVKYVRFTAITDDKEYCYVKDNVTGQYLWKGSNVK